MTYPAPLSLLAKLLNRKSKSDGTLVISRPILLSCAFLGGSLLCGVLLTVSGCNGKKQEPSAADVIRGEPKVFVGHQKCAECHFEITEKHLQTGHAHTFRMTAESEIAELLCGKTLDVSEPYEPYHYTCDQLGLAVEVKEFPGRLFPIQFALGSAEHATTFFTLMPDAQGKTRGIEHRMTYYSSDGEFDVTLGQQNLTPQRSAEYFGRVFDAETTQRCIACHTTTARLVNGQVENLRPGVHCEKCHGPGSQHVAAAESDLVPLAKSLIEYDWSHRDEIMMCGRCHRVPDEIDEDRLKRYPRSLVRFQPVGLLKSRCFTESGGQLSCSTCHPPHQSAGTATPAEQIASCLNCHSNAEQTHCPVSPQTDCIRCHLPPITLVRDIQFHDHWIRVRTGETDSEKENDAENGHQLTDSSSGTQP